MLLDEDSVQRGVKVLSIPNSRGLDRRERIEHRARSERDPGFAQSAGEMGDVLRQDAAGLPVRLPKSRSFRVARSHFGGEAPVARIAPKR